MQPPAQYHVPHACLCLRPTATTGDKTMTTAATTAPPPSTPSSMAARQRGTTVQHHLHRGQRRFSTRLRHWSDALVLAHFTVSAQLRALNQLKFSRRNGYCALRDDNYDIRTCYHRTKSKSIPSGFHPRSWRVFPVLAKQVCPAYQQRQFIMTRLVCSLLHASLSRSSFPQRCAYFRQMFSRQFVSRRIVSSWIRFGRRLSSSVTGVEITRWGSCDCVRRK